MNIPEGTYTVLLTPFLNNGVIDKSFSVNWNDYRNCILLIQAEGFNRIDTKVKEIINLS